MFTHCQKFNKPIKNPVGYYGTQSLSVALLLVVGAEKKLLPFLHCRPSREAQKVLNGISGSDCRNYTKIVDKLELWFGVEKQHESHQVCLSNRRR